MVCGGCGFGALLSTSKGKKRTPGQNSVQNYYINDDHSLEITDSIVHRSNVGNHINICPYCGRRLHFAEVPNFCPYCEKRL